MTACIGVRLIDPEIRGHASKLVTEKAPSLTCTQTIFYVDDMAATKAFYKRVFDMEPSFESPAGRFMIMKTQPEGAIAFGLRPFVETHMVGQKTVAATPQTTPLAVEICFTTDNLEALFKKVVSAGASPVVEPKRLPWGDWCAYVKDNNGLFIELTQPDAT